MGVDCPGSVTPDSPESPDGTEGYASITLTLLKETPDDKRYKIQTNACFVKNDEHLKNLQSTEYEKTHKETKFFLYFYCSESDLSNRLVESRIVAHRFTKPNKDKDCIIENKWKTNKPFFSRDNHVFLPVSHKKLKTNDFTMFLEHYSKAVTLIENLSVGKYRGVQYKKLPRAQNSNVPVELCPFSMSMSKNNKLNITIPADSTFFQNLVHGPLLYEEASKRWRLIGWYEKAPNGDRSITVSHLGRQVPPNQLPVANQPETRLPHKPPSGSTDGVSPHGINGQQVANPLPTNQPVANRPEARMPHQPPTGSTVVMSSHGVNGQQALQDLLNEDRVLDCLAIHLDIDYKSKYKNWRQLADEMKAPQDIKDKCKCKTVHSPTLTLLDRPDIQNKTIQELMNVTANITYVSNFLKEKFPGAEDRSKSIKEGLCCNPKLKDAFATKLDRQPSRVRKNWRDIGSLLGIDEDDLDLIEKGGHNPAEKLLLNAYKSLSTEKTKAKEFRRIIMGFEKRNDLHDLLVKWGITENDDRPLKNIIPPNSENMKKMTAALNRCPPGLKNWKNLASSWNCDSDQFDYPAEQSPTNTLLEWVRDSMDHEVTVGEFLNILGDRMKRYDVKRELEKLIKKN